MMQGKVRVKSAMPPGHVRTPAYLRGKIGEIEREIGPFGNPEEQAYGRIGAKATLYRVRFTMAELWGDASAAHDTLDAEIYGHWLDPLEAKDAP